MNEIHHDEAGARRRISARSCALWGCGGLLAVAIFGLIAFRPVMEYGVSRFVPQPERFLRHIDEQELSEAYAMVSGDWKEQQSFDEFRSFCAVLRHHLGEFQGGSASELQMGSKSDRTRARLAYEARYARSSCRVTFTLVKTEEGWSIDAADFVSGPLAKAYRCDSCGTTNAVGAEHCTACGKEIDPLRELKPRRSNE